MACLTLSLGLSLGLSAAGATAQDRPPKGPRATLFISPAGQPFHADPGQPYPVRLWFAEADRNHDGELSREEFRDDFKAFFNQLDANHDGFVDDQEIANYEQVVAPEVLPRLAQYQGGDGPGEGNPASQGNSGQGGQGQGGQGRGGPGQGGPGQGGQGQGGRRGGGRGGMGGATPQLASSQTRKNGPIIDGAPQFSLLNISEPVTGADTNFDGKVSLEEFLAAGDRRFDALDAYRLGYLTLSGLPQTPEQIAVEGKRKKQG